MRAKAQGHKEATARSPKRSRHTAGEGAHAGPSQSQFMSSPYPQPTIHVRSPSEAQQPLYTLSVSRPSRPPSHAASSSSSSLAPSDSISVRSSLPPSRSRRSQRDFSPAFLTDPWTDGRQTSFEDWITCLTASAGLPLSWVENPEWLNFCADFVPQAKSPSRKVLTRRLLPQTLAGFQAKAMQGANGKNATASCDGWTGENFHHYITFMIMVGKEVHPHT